MTAGAGAIGNYDHSSFKTQGQGSFRGNNDSKPSRGEILKDLFWLKRYN